MIRPPLPFLSGTAILFFLLGITWVSGVGYLLFGVDDAAFVRAGRVALLCSLVLFAGMSVRIWYAGRQVRRGYQRMKERMREERRQQQQLLAQEILRAEEMERKKLGEELHDNINQLLGVIKLYIEHAQRNPDTREEMLAKAGECVRLVISEIRSLSRSMISPGIPDPDLLRSIEELAGSIAQAKGIEINMRHTGFSGNRLSDTQRLMVYRILQEQLHNIVKHSGAAHVIIELCNEGTTVRLRIEDDGVGFDTSRVHQGVGLKNIRHRLELLNGTMKVESSPLHGCRLEAAFETSRQLEKA